MDAGATADVPTSPWGKLIQPTDPVCLADIMSEELAKDLQIKEEGRYIKDLVAEPETLPIIECAPDCDSDHIIAQMLQVQFDKEYDSMLKKTEDKFNGSSKVCVSYSNYRIIPENLVHDTDSEDDEDKGKEWDSFVSTEKAFKGMPKRGYQKKGDELVTKHDMTMSGRRNACRVMEFPPEFQTGDGGGFDMQLSNKVFNSLKVYSRNEQSRRHRLHDKTEQATAEMSVDARTRLLLYRLVNQEVLDRVNGIISTGKEAVVLHADGGAGRDCVIPKECAIKIFKTTLNEFKARDKYIQDDYRFKDRFSKQNPRKVIHMWAEKEMHNLMRMRKFGILCPEVVVLKKHILVMSFIGEGHKPAKKLKEAFLKPAELTEAYLQITAGMNSLYKDAQLVHSDLSEYNILWHNKQCWFIDVSQSVDRNHPKALEFLYRDCVNVSSFFKKKGAEEMKSAEELFTDITGLAVSEGGVGVLGQVQNFERNELLLAHEQAEKHYPFEYCWEQSKNE
jgi:RIO kinase 3